MMAGSASTYLLPDEDWAYFMTFVLPDYCQHGPRGVSRRAPSLTHMELGKSAVKEWFNRHRKPLEAMSENRNSPLVKACCVPEFKDTSGNPTPLHFHALIARSPAFEQMFAITQDGVREQSIWHRCVEKQFKTTNLGNTVVCAEIKNIYCIFDLKKYIMKNVENDFNVKNIIDIKY